MVLEEVVEVAVHITVVPVPTALPGIMVEVVEVVPVQHLMAIRY
jgi:hypothetical protein